MLEIKFQIVKQIGCVDAALRLFNEMVKKPQHAAAIL